MVEALLCVCVLEELAGDAFALSVGVDLDIEDEAGGVSDELADLDLFVDHGVGDLGVCGVGCDFHWPGLSGCGAPPLVSTSVHHMSTSRQPQTETTM